MTPLRQIFASSVLGLAIVVGSGCASQGPLEQYTEERPAGIPSDAVVAGTGTAALRFTPVADGRVYIYDRTADKLLYEGALRRGELVEVDSQDNRILVSGRVVSDRDLKPGHDKEIFFRPEPVATVVEERTVRYEKDRVPLPLPATLPPEASLMTTGDANLRFKPTTDGRVFIYDREADKLLYQGHVDRGEVVEVDSRNNRILIGGNTASELNLRPGHDKEIYFKTEPTLQERTIRKEKTIERELERQQ
jgi:ribosomal protein L24